MEYEVLQTTLTRTPSSSACSLTTIGSMLRVGNSPSTARFDCVHTEQHQAAAQQQMADLLEEQGEKVRVNEDTVYPTLVRILEQQYISTIILRTKEGKTITLDVEASDTIDNDEASSSETEI